MAVTCEDLLPFTRAYLTSVVLCVEFINNVFLGNNVRIHTETMCTDLDNHSFSLVSTYLDVLTSDLLAALDGFHFPRSIRNVLRHFVSALHFVSHELVPYVRHSCHPGCARYQEIPLAVAQSPPDPESENSSDDSLDALVSALTITSNVIQNSPSQRDDPAPCYDYPPNYFSIAADNTIPLPIFRWGMETFMVLWDHLMNHSTNPTTVQYDLYDFVTIQRTRDNFFQMYRAGKFQDPKDMLRNLENQFDHIKWYGRRRTEEYFRRHYPDAVATMFEHHISCPCCLTQTIHCYLEPRDIHNCGNPSKCYRETTREMFEKDSVISYTDLYTLLTQRKFFGMEKVFDYYAKSGDHSKFPTFLANIEQSMLLSGYTSNFSRVSPDGSKLALVFAPRPMWALDPKDWKDIYEKCFDPVVQGHYAKQFAKFLSIALSGSLRQARLWHLADGYHKEQLWEGYVNWDYVEPFARNLETLPVRLVLDSIFTKFRSGLPWNLKSEMLAVEEIYQKTRQNHPAIQYDMEYMYFVGLLRP